MHGQPRPVVPMFPTTHAQLVLTGNTMNSFYKSSICQAATMPNYYNYLEHCYDWTEATRRKIDWPVYKQIICHFCASHTTLVKHLHDITPSGHIAHQNNQHHPKSCPGCDHVNETNDNVLLCPVQSCCEWQSKLKRTLQERTCSAENDLILIDILCDGMTTTLAIA